MDTQPPDGATPEPSRESSRTMRIDLTPDILQERAAAHAAHAPKRPTIRITKTKAASGVVGDSDFQQLFQNVYDGALIADYSGRIVDANVRACQFFGHEHADLCRMEVFDLLCGADETLLPTIRENLANTRFVLLQAFFLRKDGSVFPTETAINHLFLSGQDYLCFFVRDITLRRQAEEQLRTEHTAIQLAGSGIAITDLESRVIYANPTALRMWGLESQDEAHSLKLGDCFGDPALAERITESVSTGQSWRQEVPARRKDGATFFVEAAATANFNADDELVGIVLSLNDISARRQAEAQREQYAEQLRLRNAEMEADLDMAREVQLALLPRQFPVFPSSVPPESSALRFHHFYRPSTTLGGDFFHVLPVSDYVAGVFACDVMGHGMRAALITAIVRSMMEELKPIAHDPGLFLSHVNREFMTILRDQQEFMFVSASYVLFDLEAHRLCFTDAGHPSPLLIEAATGAVSPLRPSADPVGPALGIIEGFTYQTLYHPLAQGDAVLLYTDGITEVEGPRREQFGELRLTEAVARLRKLPPDELLAGLAATAEAFSAGRGFDDDVCMVLAGSVRLP
jgi:sigma-B regulation protein RsbU (phosphoserine phosphatase)